ncbi:MAG TPA: PAS domain S-box protein, partial [Devosia sp.]|nr:PAS domain S-box protein [Devosia sp.]
DAISDYAIFMLDAAGYVASWNPGAERFKGYIADEIIGQHFSRFYTLEDRATGLPARALHTAATEGHFEHEGWRLRKVGTRFWAHVVIDPIISPEGDLLGFAKVTRDLTVRRASEEALRLSEERFRQLVEGVTDYAIYMLDPDGRVTNWNAGAERIKGYTPAEIIGEHFSRFYTDADRLAGEPERALRTARDTGRFEKEGVRVRKDGTRFWANVVIDAIRDEQGVLIGFTKITRDITERKASEQALAQASVELMQSQKMEAIGRLTGGVAHDFNNLLMAVTGSLELLRKRMPDDPRLLRLLDNAMQGAQRGASLTQRMLAFARRQELKPAPVDVRALVEGMTDLLSRSLGPSVELKTDLPGTVRPVLIDANQLELAILNLAVNAKDAMPQGGRLLLAAREERVSGNGALADGDYVCLSIRDNGSGMDAETLEHATEPFFTTKGVGKGTGLGLAMVRGLTEQSGGTITIESVPAEGTTVTLWLPVSAIAAEPAGTAPARPEPPASPGRLKVLVVDDDVLVAMNTTAMLEDLGHEAVEVHSGRLALEALAAQPDFDLMITDQAMPKMTGMQLIAAARERLPQLPVILATGYAELPAEGPSVPRLGKPFMQDDLARALAQLRPALAGA